jgi:hypothetical protein
MRESRQPIKLILNVMFKSTLLSKNTKIKIYKTLIRPVLTYGYEVRSLKAEDTKVLLSFERRILRKIFGPTQKGDGNYRIRNNHELEALIKRENVIRFIKPQRIQWLGHAVRMPQERAAKVALTRIPNLAK